MATTQLKILFGKNALTLHGDFTVTVNAGGEQSLALASDLENENTQKKYATYEPDYWLMDGSYKFIPDEVSVGYMSTELSGSGGAFTTSPELQFDFGDHYDTTGLTLYFGETTGDYCDDIDVAFYDTTQTSPLIRTDNYTPTGTTFATGQAVTGFDRIIITLNNTNNPYRLARLINIDFDAVTRWEGGNIKSGRLIEQVNPLSLEISSNEIEFTLYSADGDFSILTPANEYESLQENEPIEAYEQIGDLEILLGRFYLEEWESLSATEARFMASDAVMLLVKPLFYCTANGASITGIYDTDEMIAKIMDAAGVDYEIDASLVGIPVWATYSGMLPVMSCRDALQQACFALGAYVTCARSRVLQIKPFTLPEAGDTFDITLDATKKSQNSPIQLRKAFTSLDLLSWDYSRIYYDVAYNILWSMADVPAGTYIFVFQTPTLPSLYDDDTDIPAPSLVDDYGRFWMKFTIVTPGVDYAIIDSGYYFEKLPIRYVIDNNTVPTTTPTNVITIDEALLVKEDDPPYSQTLTNTIQNVISYHLRRIVQQTKTFGENIKAGDTISVVSQGETIFGIVEKASINLTGGFVADLTIVGTIDKTEQSITYDDDAERFTYNGFTHTDTNTGHYGGEIQYSADTESGYFEFFFIGTRFDLIYYQNTGYGSVTIYIDNETIETISQAGAATYQQEWNSPEMANTYHHVKVTKVGTSNIVNVDAVKVYYK